MNVEGLFFRKSYTCSLFFKPGEPSQFDWACRFPFLKFVSGPVFFSGPIPDGADAVVQVEDSELIKDPLGDSKRVRILTQTSKGVDIRPVV